MRFQQLVFRTTPRSIVEWLDGELEKRGIDCVYTHSILSILQEDSDAEPDECLDVRNNQQKVYHKYGGPESLYSATKSKHQKWKTYDKQVLLTTSLSFYSGISDVERKKRNAAVNCLKSVSDDNTVEDLIDELCLKLKNAKNMNATDKMDSVKKLNMLDKETPFYIPPSSPTDQVEKYFAAFPPLNKKIEETNDSNQILHLNAWYDNCSKKNENAVQNVFNRNQINYLHNSENLKNMAQNSFGSRKSVENIYKSGNNISENFHKKPNPLLKHGGNYIQIKFCDKNTYNHLSLIGKSENKIFNLSNISDKINELDIQIFNENEYVTSSKITNVKSKHCPTSNNTILDYDVLKIETNKKTNLSDNKKNSLGELPMQLQEETLKSFNYPLNNTASFIKSDVKKSKNVLKLDSIRLSSNVEILKYDYGKEHKDEKTGSHEKCYIIKELGKILSEESKLISNEETLACSTFMFEYILKNIEGHHKSCSGAIVNDCSYEYGKLKEQAEIAVTDPNVNMYKIVPCIKNVDTFIIGAPFNFKNLSSGSVQITFNIPKEFFEIKSGEYESKNCILNFLERNIKTPRNAICKFFKVDEICRKSNMGIPHTNAFSIISFLKEFSNNYCNSNKFTFKIEILVNENKNKTYKNNVEENKKKGHASNASEKYPNEYIIETTDITNKSPDVITLSFQEFKLESGNTNEIPSKWKNVVTLGLTLNSGENFQEYGYYNTHIYYICNILKMNYSCDLNISDFLKKDSLYFSKMCSYALKYLKCIDTKHKSCSPNILKYSRDFDVKYEVSKHSYISATNDYAKNKSSSIYDEDEIKSLFHCTSDKLCSLSQNIYSYEKNENIPGTSLELSKPFDCVIHQSLTGPLINMIKIGDNIYYGFDPQIALNFFSEIEIFNIITTGNINEVDCFLSKFSILEDLDFSLSQNLEGFQDCNIDSTLPNRKQIAKFCQIVDNGDTELPIKKFPILYPLPRAINNEQSSSWPAKNASLATSEKINSCLHEFSQNYLFSTWEQPNQILKTHDLFDNWDYPHFNDCSVQTSDVNSDINQCNIPNCTCSSFQINDSLIEKNENILPNECKHLLTDNHNIRYYSDPFYMDVENEFSAISPCVSAEVESSDNFEPFSDIEKNYSLSFDKKFPTILSDTITSNSVQSDNTNVNFFCLSVGSAFRLLKEHGPKIISCHLNGSAQKLLKKVINIDRVIHRINAKNRVTVFLKSHHNSLPFIQPNDSHIFPHTPIKIFPNSLDVYSYVGTGGFKQCNSIFVCDSHASVENTKYSHLGQNCHHCSKFDKTFRSIWGKTNNTTECIWKHTGSVKSENNHILSCTSNIDTINENFDEDLLKDIFSIDYLKEIDLTYTEEQNVSKQDYESHNAEQFIEMTEISRYDLTVSSQAASDISNSNKHFDISLSVPHVDPVGVFSLDNCKSDTLELHMKSSEVGYPISLENEAYQESDFIDLSAFRGPYGSYSESRKNYMEGGGWSLDSDSYLLEPVDFHDCSLQDRNMTGSEKENFHFMQFDRLQFSSEDDEIARMNTASTRWPNCNFRRRTKHKYPPFKRPCTFYMEGNCNRSDCKFSHDLSNITCRFWQEGSCFKGSTCPFLHGYIEHKILDIYKNSSKCEREKNYSLDSETDFPSLSSTKCETSASKSDPVDIVNKKRFKN